MPDFEVRTNNKRTQMKMANGPLPCRSKSWEPHIPVCGSFILGDKVDKKSNPGVRFFRAIETRREILPKRIIILGNFR